MFDQSLLLRTISDFTRVLLSPYDVTQTLAELTDRLTELLDLVGSGVSLFDNGRLNFDTAYGPAVAAVESTQDDQQAGPCVDAVRRGEPVAVSDVRDCAERWPAYVAAATAMGIGSVASIPMQVDDRIVGALDLYARGTREWTEAELGAAEVLANMATVCLVNASQHHKQVELNRQLQEALDSRIVIEQAKGMVAVRHGISLSQAFERIRKHARHRGATLRAVAEAVVNLDLDV